MGTDFRRTELKITSDPRLWAGVRGALECICERHGLSKAEQHDLATAVENKCGDELHNPEQSSCAVSISESDEKIEVSVAPAAHANGAKPNVQGAYHPQRNGRSSATFVKHFQKHPTRN